MDNKDRGKLQTFPLEITDLDYDGILAGLTTDPVLIRQANLVYGDPYYSRLYSRLRASVSHPEAVRTLIAAGCFDDLLEERIQHPINFMSAPYPQVKRLHEEAKTAIPGMRHAVVVSTGSYDPLHEGHMESIVRAKEFIEASGKAKVIAGFMSPSHDSYVRRKNPGGIVDFQRVHENTVYLENSEYNKPQQWIFHENWEALGINLAVNFTDVVIYIDGMLKAHVGNDIDVYYVFGGDNAAFGLTFAHDDETMVKGICVGRPGYDIDPDIAQQIETSSTLFYTEGYNGMSSTQIRALREKQNEPIQETKVELPFVLRNDLALSASWMKPILGSEVFNKKCDDFVSKLQLNLKSSFNEVKTIDVEEQLKLTAKYLKNNFANRKVLSCDVYFKGDKNLRASRLFDISSSQKHGKTSHFASPLNIREKDNTEYVFVDDDIVSGFFLSEVKKYFRITDAVSMADISLQESYLDIADARDFLVGASHGGLMMDAQKPFRAPYLAPFVNMVSRLTMPAGDIRAFNIALWQANADFYAGTGLTLGNLPKEQTAFMQNMGFAESTLVSDVCLKYREMF